MASFSTSSNSLIFLLFFTVLFAIPITSYPLDNICKQTRNPDFCFNLLKPHSNASLLEILQFMIDTTSSNVTKTSDKIQSLFSKTNDPTLKAIYGSCSKDYTAALGFLKTAQEKLKSRDYGAMTFASNWVYYNAFQCQQTISKAPSQPIPIASDNDNVELLSNILVVAARILGGSV